MATVKPKAKKKVTRKPSQASANKNFMAALKALEEMAKAQIGSAKNPYKTGMLITGEIRKMALRIENEIEDSTRSLTEAYDSGSGVVGVGIGVF